MRRLYTLYSEGGLQEVRRGITDYYVNHLRLREMYTTLTSKIGPRLPSDSIWERDWDVLCVLDGCRLDTFREVVDEDCDTLRSVGSTSQTWIPQTFDNHNTSTVGYITGNPFSTKTNTSEFAYYREIGVESAHGIETVPPKQLTDCAIRAWRQRNDLGIDQLVVHYMQPHVPFRSRPEWFKEWKGSETWGSSVWERLRTGDISRDELFEAYRDNLRWVWEETGVARLRENCDARIAATADHGNAAGEWGFYGHPKGAPAPAIRHVPWTTLSGFDSHEIQPDVTLKQSDGERDVEASLEALGYK